MNLLKPRRRSGLAAAICLLALAALASADSSPNWLRYPAISPDGQNIVFTYKGDLYRVPAVGGTGVALTSHEAEDFMPVWSPDGKQIAFASDRHGNFDIFVMPAEGGPSTRLTFDSAAETPFSFTPDGKAILFGAARQDPADSRMFPTGSQPELYRVPVTGGRVEQVLATPAEEVQTSRDGQLVLYHDKKGGENAWRKHHTSAIARDIWVYDKKAGTHRKLTTYAGEDRTPIFTEDQKGFYYLSEESGSFNVHRMGLSGGASQQITSFNTMPVRFLTRSDSGLLCFGYDGAIYTVLPDSEPHRVEIAIAADARANNEKVVAVTGGAREFAVSPSGKEIAFIARGEVFVTSVEGGVTKRITETPGQERGVSFSPDGKALLYAAERGNRWKIYETRKVREAEPHFYASTLLKETPLVDNDKENYQPAYSPDGKQVAYIEDRMTLRVLNLEAKATRTLLTSQELFSGSDTDQYFQWSPDSKWLLFDYAVPGVAPGEIGLVRADGKGTVMNLSRSGFGDGQAKWVLGGKAMMWQSNRDGLKSVAQSGRSEQDVYGMFFTREAWDRFRLSKEEFALVKEAEEKEKKDKDKDKSESEKEKKDDKAEAKPADLSFDMDGLETRKARLTIHSSSLGDALLSKDGETLYYLAQFEKGMNLWSTVLRTKETKMLVSLDASRARIEWDKDQKNLFLLSDGSLSKIDLEKVKREPIAIKGEMTSDDAAERLALFEHVWRRTATTFYRAGYHGADWTALKTAYLKYVPHIGNNFEFAEMLSEMLGELNVSHSGARVSAPDPGDDATASLGLLYDQAFAGPGVKIDEVIKDGPLDKASVSLKPGMIVEAVDGEVIAANADIAQDLNRKAGKPTLLTVRDGDKTMDVVVKPITAGEENRLLYTRWVRRNQDEVERLSGGQLGYIHVPGMSDGAYRTAYEEVMGRFADRKGIVVDTRFNGGGDLVADLAMFLSGKKFFDYGIDNRNNGYEPNFRWTKPSISLSNEAAYSDGHCYAYTVRALGLGKLVGMPVPGTCTFAGWEALADTGIRWGVPPVGVKDTNGAYLENRQTEPDILVANRPEVVVKGRDEQLEAAVAALMKEIK